MWENDLKVGAALDFPSIFENFKGPLAELNGLKYLLCFDDMFVQFYLKCVKLGREM